MSKPRPKGPNGTYTTSQRVPWTGTYVDQYGGLSYHKKGGTFPPCPGRQGGPAYRALVTSGHRLSNRTSS